MAFNNEKPHLIIIKTLLVLAPILSAVIFETYYVMQNYEIIHARVEALEGNISEYADQVKSLQAQVGYVYQTDDNGDDNDQEAHETSFERLQAIITNKPHVCRW